MNARFKFVLLCSLIALSCVAGRARAQQYSVVDLGTLGGNNPSAGQFNTIATAINNSGQVVGWSYETTAPAAFRGFVYQNGSMSSLGTLGGTYSYALDINDNGQIVGESHLSGSNSVAYLYSGGSMQPLGSLPGGANSGANAINNAGQIAGFSRNSAGDRHAVSFSGGAVNDLGTLGGTVSSVAGINNAGQMVGSSFYQGNSRQAFLVAGAPMTGLGFAPGTGHANESWAAAINDAGVIAGTVHTTAGYRAATFANGTWTSLGEFSPFLWHEAFAINNHGDVVGSYGNLLGPKGVHNQQASRAFLYHGGSLLDLNDHLDGTGAGWNLKAAYDVNDNGWIVGVGINPSGQYQSYLLIPVPEPGSFVLACTGAASLATVAVLRFRRRRRSQPLQD